MAANGLDLLLVALLVAGMVRGLRQGVIQLLGGMASLIIALLISATSFKSAAYWVEKEWGLQDILASWITSSLPASPVGGGSIQVPLLGLADPVQYLAYLALLALTFITMLTLLTGLGNGLVFITRRLLCRTGLGGLDRLLGMGVGIIEGLLIIILLIGIIYPFAKTGAQLGLGSAGFIYGLLEHSRLTPFLLAGFALFQGWLGMSV